MKRSRRDDWEDPEIYEFEEEIGQRQFAVCYPCQPLCFPSGYCPPTCMPTCRPSFQVGFPIPPFTVQTPAGPTTFYYKPGKRPVCYPKCYPV